MTTLLLYLFYLLAPPAPVLVCSLWVSQPPTASQLLAACGEIVLEQYEVHFVNIWDKKTYCIKNASAVYAPGEACHLGSSLDNFRMDIYQPAQGEQVLCAVESYSPQPSPEEVTAACGTDHAAGWQAGRYDLRLISTSAPGEPGQALPPAPLPGAGLLEMPSGPAALATADNLYLLSNRIGNPDEWQNRYDAEIYQAAARWHVPPKLLKRLIMAETQFYPATGAAGELGLVQLTEGGIDLMLLYTLPGYARQTPERRQLLRGEIIISLACDGCNTIEAAEAARNDFDTYARALAAYYLCYGSWENALTAWNIKHAQWVN